MADQPLQVILGVDTHAQVHVACLLDHLGRRLGTLAIPTTRAGYQQRGRRRGHPHTDPGAKRQRRRRALGRHRAPECVDHLLITGHRHLHRVLGIHARHYNRHRPHHSLDLSAPQRPAGYRKAEPLIAGQLRRRDVLGGLIHEYDHAA
jgi:hypothetical protein